MGSSSDANTIRIGTPGTQTATFIAGVSGILSGGSEATELAVNRTTGQVGVIPSSARFKRDIHDMGGASTDLMKLRPVTFRYKQDSQGPRQYGLIAEEVAKVYPELVVRDDKGEIESVQYRELIPLMLNEMQHQQATLTTLEAQNAALQARLERLEGGKTVASR
jgi:trimeric autotransporter adhesin